MISSILNLKNIIQVNNYPEAAGILQALKKGIGISSLYRPLATLKFQSQTRLME